MTNFFKQYSAFRKFLRNETFQNVFKLAGSSVTGQAIALAATPILSRVYSPESFGHFSIFISCLSLLMIISNLRYDLAIPVPKHRAQAINLLFVSLLITFCFAFLLFLSIFFFNDYLAKVTNGHEIRHIFWLLPIGLLFHGIISPFRHWNIRQQNFNILAKTNISKSVVNASSSCSLYHYHAFGLVASHLIAQLTTALILIGDFLSHSKTLVKHIGPRRMLGALIKFRDFVLFSSPTGLIVAIGRHTPNLYLAYAFEVSDLGQLAFVQRLLTAPTTLVVAAFGQVFFSKAAKCTHANQLTELVKNTSKKLFLISIFVSGVVFITSPVIPIVFGSKWTLAASIVPFLIPNLIGEITVAPLTYVFVASNQPRKALFPQLILMVTRISVLILSANYYSFVSTIALYSLANAFGYFVLYLFIKKACLFDHQKDRIIGNA